MTLHSYIVVLYEKQHILEAQYFYEQLKKEDPAGFETNKLGFLLAIRRMDSKVGEFEKNLIAAGATQEQLRRGIAETL